MSGERPEWTWESEFDGGEKGCGELLSALRTHFQELSTGTRVLVTTRDPGAPMELPSWCRLTGHRLLDSRPPHYLVEAR